MKRGTGILHGREDTPVAPARGSCGKGSARALAPVRRMAETAMPQVHAIALPNQRRGLRELRGLSAHV